MKTITKEIERFSDQSAETIEDFIKWLNEMKRKLLTAQLKYPERVYKRVEFHVTEQQYDEGAKCRILIVYDRPETEHELKLAVLQKEAKQLQELEQVRKYLTSNGIPIPDSLKDHAKIHNTIFDEREMTSEELIEYNRKAIVEAEKTIKIQDRVDRQQESWYE